MNAVPRRAILGAAIAAATAPAAGSTAAPHADAALIQLHASLHATEAAHEAAVSAASDVEERLIAQGVQLRRGHPEMQDADARVDAAGDTWAAVIGQMAAIPAAGMAGVAVKVARLCAALDDGVTRQDGRLADSLLADMARLAPGALT
ncbi:hypothetical protein [Roseomonas sp. BN140053]|uniref:hypothetical protein n=1 Tax=Roseomonas sp. BN140053 TaxID=3391898 RepID=UPI0039ED5533